MNFIIELVEKVNSLLWEKNILVVLLVGAGIITTFKTRFMQIRLLGQIISVFSNEEKKEDGVSSIETFFLGTACRVGAGNIAGVVAAIAVGGPGSIFWMWLVAILGAATAFVEATLSVKYRDRDRDGNYIGGTPWILKKKYGAIKAGSIYAVASIICYAGVTQVMANSVSESISSAYNINQKTITIILTIIVALIIFGKGKKDKIIESLNKIVPIMAGLYITIALYIILINAGNLPGIFKLIFTEAFGGKEVIGGGIGTIIMQGVRRGLFSNEAGSGNSNYGSALVNDKNPAKQGMVQALGILVDTLIICSATAFIILLAGAEKTKNIQGMLINGMELSGMPLFQEALKSHIGVMGVPFTAIVIFFFSLSTILAVAFYGKNALKYLSEKIEINYLYQVLIIAMVYTGGVTQNLFVWSLADFGLGIMTIINIIYILPIIKEALSELKLYEVDLAKEKEELEKRENEIFEKNNWKNLRK